jgi:hypothetical protein
MSNRQERLNEQELLPSLITQSCFAGIPSKIVAEIHGWYLIAPTYPVFTEQSEHCRRISAWLPTITAVVFVVFFSLYCSGSQTFSAHDPLGSINSPPVPLALPNKKHYSQQRFAQPTKEDNDNKIRYLI